MLKGAKCSTAFRGPVIRTNVVTLRNMCPASALFLFCCCYCFHRRWWWYDDW